MTRVDVALLLIGTVLLLTGVGLIYVPAAFITAGVGLLALGLLRDIKADDDKETR